MTKGKENDHFDLGSRVLVASSNKGKLRELSQVFANVDIECLPQSELGITDAVEDGLSFVENAIKKARHASRESGLAALADDSGLEVPALNGAPGIYSARFAGVNATDQDNNERLLADMADLRNEQRRACFRCVLVLMRHDQDPTPMICQGSWWGEVLAAPRGTNGFGYDPLFFLPEQNCTSAELDSESKNKLSHRGQALQQLLQRLLAQSSSDT
ncbi:MAG: RdgB/HAM1 family non-canonical purine NTP pyrophosphatase [Pseudomonadales bacterium]